VRRRGMVSRAAIGALLLWASSLITPCAVSLAARLVEEGQRTGTEGGSPPELTPPRSAPSRKAVPKGQVPGAQQGSQGSGSVTQQTESGGQAPSQPKRPGGSDRITINFDNADLRTVIKFISELTGKNFVVDDKVKGTVTIISPTDITVDEAYHVFLSVLEMKGFTVVESGKVFKVVPSAEARYRDIETLRPEDAVRVGREDRIITQLVPLRHASANDLRGLLTPMVSKESQIVAYQPTNTLIITDYASNIRRLQALIKEMDVESTDEKITVHPLKYASAQVLATELLSLMDRGGAKGGAPARSVSPKPVTQPSQPTPRPATPGQITQPAGAEEAAALSVSKLVPDERTNSLIIIASEAETRKILDLVDKLDVPLPPGRKKIHVYYLENAKAEEVLQVLSQLSGRGGVGVGYGTAAGLGTTRSGLGTGTTGLGSGGLGGLSSSGGLSGSTGLGTTGLGTSRTAGLGTGGAGLFSSGIERGPRAAILGEDVVVVADKATNAIIVMAPPEDYETVKELIGKLDVWRPQVLVEALIAEVSLTKTKSLGVEWQFAERVDSSGRETGIQTGTGPANLDFSTAAQFLFGVFKGPITIAGQQFTNLKAVLRAFQRAEDVNILSTPHILTLNNEEAEIVVAQNIPFLKSQTGTAESTVPGTTTPTTAVLQTFEFKDVGIILRITPQISKGKFVRLNIFQEVSDVGAQQVLTTTPTTFKRQAKTVVVVEDGQTVVIGGLIQDSQRQSTSGVPCLGSVPLLGNLFRTQSVGPQEKRNLLIFITPHIVNTPEDMAGITEQKRKERERDAEKFQEWRGEDFGETLDMILR
jgi:general secretion pathway protein D